MSVEGNEFVGFALAEGGIDEIHAEENLVEVEEAGGSGGEGEKRNERELPLVAIFTAFSVGREIARWS